ncbi:MAG: hypothetical protein Q8J88_01025 [Bacteroidales bacterium]|nr:hypothetical protein [Bacteroidales bacterium]
MAKQSKVTHEDKVLNLSELKDHPSNPNTHTHAQIDAMVQSMDRYGQYYRIICDENNQIICGHGKKMALQKKGEKVAKVTIIKGLNEKQKLKLLLEDNKIQSMSYVNFTQVEALIKDIGEMDIIGFSPEYLDTILNEVSLDNMGVDFTKPGIRNDNFSNDLQVEQNAQYEDIDAGMQPARTMKCPHCGGEITI